MLSMYACIKGGSGLDSRAGRQIAQMYCARKSVCVGSKRGCRKHIKFARSADLKLGTKSCRGYSTYGKERCVELLMSEGLFFFFFFLSEQHTHSPLS